MTFDQFKNEVICSESRRGSRSFDYCNWFLGKLQVLHERDYNFGNVPDWKSPPSHHFNFITREPSFHYWSEAIYSDLDLAKREAKKYGAIVRQGFYCDADNLYWFLIFDDLDKALFHAFESLTISKNMV